MIVLGLHKDPWHNSGAAIVRSGTKGIDLCCISEERCNRVKNSRAFPERSTHACMEHLGISGLDEVDLIVLDHICDDADWRKDFHHRPCSVDNFLATVEPAKIHIMNHHLAHAYATFYSSGFDSAAVLIVDGRGSRKETQSLYRASLDRGMELIESTTEIGIGLMYATMTQACGFKLLEEGKTMGLAPYGANQPGPIMTFSKKYDGLTTDYSDVCVAGSYDLKSEIEDVDSFDRRARLAYEVQNECEEAYLHLVRYAHEKTGEDRLCLSGGVALNSVANYKVLRSGVFQEIFINPAASDTGIPLGAALYGFHHLLEQPKNYDTISPYVGPAYNTERVVSAIDSFEGYRVVEEDAQIEAARWLAANKIVGHFSSRSEMGPRALGNRSILMSPLVAENKDVLNARVKFREEFRPFAPVVLEERREEYFVLDRPSPYMLLVADIRQEKRAEIPAVTHVDGTGRVQTVSREFNPPFYTLIERFCQATGTPVILNTSFNVAGEPIVESPEDAIRCFLSTDIDALLIEDRLLVKDGRSI